MKQSRQLLQLLSFPCFAIYCVMETPFVGHLADTPYRVAWLSDMSHKSYLLWLDVHLIVKCLLLVLARAGGTCVNPHLGLEIAPATATASAATVTTTSTACALHFNHQLTDSTPAHHCLSLLLVLACANNSCINPHLGLKVATVMVAASAASAAAPSTACRMHVSSLKF